MADEVVNHPTYMEHIRHFFEEDDIEHMKRRGFDFSTYERLKAVSMDVFFQTQPPNANMPPDPARKWSSERSQTFMNWIRDGHPLGVPEFEPVAPAQTGRVRKSLDELQPQEIEKLKVAFAGIQQLSADDENGYFYLAGLHWYPLPFKCKHHESRYNPWHRAYLIVFEDALRSVPGCEDVTLPYWDITKRPPDFLFQPPFDSYTFPLDVHEDYRAGDTTRRYSAGEIAERVVEENVPATIATAMSQPYWEDFVTYEGEGIEAAHDSGHGAVGDTLSVPDTAAFDPMFWFFHANWDRLWWEWQQALDATSVAKFRTTIKGSSIFLDPPANVLDPFELTADQTIDLAALGVSYTTTGAQLRPEPVGSGHLFAHGPIRIPPEPRVSVRVKGIHRLSIPGSFRVILYADRQPVGRRSFFQSSHPEECDNCRSNPEINLDFRVRSSDVVGRDLSVEIELVKPQPSIGQAFPLSAAGSPTVNVRMLLND